MANALLTSTKVLRESLRVLHNKCSFIGTINRQYDNQYAVSGAKIGNTLKVRLPNRFVVRTGENMAAQDVTEQSVDIVMATQKGVDMNFSSVDLTLSLDDFSKRIIDPAMSVLAANVEADAFNMYKDVYNGVGTPGTTPATLEVILQGRAKMNQFLTPIDKNRSIQINSDANVKLVDALKGLFHDSKAVEKQYKEGIMGRTAGFTWFENQLVPVHTVGNKVAGVTVNEAAQTGSALNIATVAAADTFKKGQIFTIAGVYAIHPETRVAYAALQQFVVTADATMGGITGTIQISPSIVTSGALQTVSGSPAAGAALTFVGSASTSYPQNLCYHEDAFSFVSADLEMPKGVDFAAREVVDGISMLIVRQYTIADGHFPCRIDLLYGYKTSRAQMASRITG